MRNAILVGLILALSGCASLHEKVLENIHQGDSADRVETILGQPDEYEPSEKVPDGMVYLYAKGGDICGIALLNNSVVSTSCRKNPNHIGVARAIGSVFQGMGQGLQNSSQTVHCTSTNYGYETEVDCH